MAQSEGDGVRQQQAMSGIRISRRQRQFVQEPYSRISIRGVANEGPTAVAPVVYLRAGRGQRYDLWEQE